MSTNNRKDYKLSYCGCFMILFFGIALFLPFSLRYFALGDFSEEICTINQINYPTQLPTFGNTSNWATCDCGRRCQSWSPCIQLFTSNYPGVLVKENILDFDSESICTFHELDCQDGENLQRASEYIDESLNIYNEYHEKNVTCYVGDEFVALNNNISDLLDILIVICSFIMLGIIFVVCNQYHNYNNKCEKTDLDGNDSNTITNPAYNV
jgi:hypothetical protein